MYVNVVNVLNGALGLRIDRDVAAPAAHLGSRRRQSVPGMLAQAALWRGQLPALMAQVLRGVNAV